MKVLLYILVWIFCWPLAVLVTVLDFLSFVAKQQQEKKDVIEMNKMNY